MTSLRQVFGTESSHVRLGLQFVPQHPVRTEKHLL